ncbi:18838_t:CDS:2, partial [Funneliformis geosporum]
SSEISTIYLSLLKDYVQGYKSSKHTWLYEGNIEFTLPNLINIKKAVNLLPNCIKKDQEVIIRDSETNQLIAVILRNHVGKEVLKYMYEIAIETSKIRRKVYCDYQTVALQQGPLFAASYLCEKLRNTSEYLENEAKIVASVAFLYNYALKYFSVDVVSKIEHFFSTYDLPRLNGNIYGLCEAYIAINYTKHVYIDKIFLKYAWACICGRGLLQNNNNISSSISSNNNTSNGTSSSFSFFSSILTDSSIYIPGNFEEHEEHGTIIIPSGTFQVGISQNISKKTVTVAKKWKEGREIKFHKQYRLNQLKQEPEILQNFL